MPINKNSRQSDNGKKKGAIIFFNKNMFLQGENLDLMG